MNWILQLFMKKKAKSNPYADMGKLGVSPTHMLMYQDSINRIKAFEGKNHD